MQLISYLLRKEEDFGYKHWSIRRLTIIPPYEPAHLQTQKLTFDGNGPKLTLADLYTEYCYQVLDKNASGLNVVT